MTTYYANSDAAPGGNGAIGSPFSTIESALAALASGDTLFVVAGSVFMPPANGVRNVPAGLGVGSETRILKTGSGANPLILDTTASTAIAFKIADPQHIIIEDMQVFGGSYMVQIAPPGNSFSSQNVRLRRLRGERQNAYGCLFQTAATATSGLDDIEIWDSTMYQSYYAGFHAVGNVVGNKAGVVPRTYGVKYYRCLADNAGGGWLMAGPSTGGHGFTNFPNRDWIAFNAITLVSGTIYQFTIPAGRSNVWRVAMAANATNVGTYGWLNENTSTPTTPAAGEYGQSAGILYLNWGTNTIPGSGAATIYAYAWGLSGGCYYEDCEARNTVDFSSNQSEGHGMAADDYRSNNTYVRCYSHDNDGYGFSWHRGESNEAFYCVVSNNNRKGSWSDWAVMCGSNHRIYHPTFRSSAFSSLPQLNLANAQLAVFANPLFDGTSSNPIGGTNSGSASTPFGIVNDNTVSVGLTSGQIALSSILTGVTGHDAIRVGNIGFIGATHEPRGSSNARYHGIWTPEYDRVNAWEAARPAEFTPYRRNYNTGIDGKEFSRVARGTGAVQTRTAFRPPASIKRALRFDMNRASGTLRFDASAAAWSGSTGVSVEMWMLCGIHPGVAGASVVWLGSGTPSGGSTRHLTIYNQPSSEWRMTMRPSNNASPERIAQLQGMEQKHNAGFFWQHLVVSMNIAARTCRFSSNGFVMAAAWAAQVAADDLLQGMDQLTLGGHTNASSSPGQIAALRMWNRVLTDAEMVGLYSSGSIEDRSNLQVELLFPSGSETVNTGLLGGNATAVGAPVYAPVAAY